MGLAARLPLGLAQGVRFTEELRFLHYSAKEPPRLWSTSPDLSSGGMASTSEGSVGLSGRPGPTTEVGAPGTHRVPRPAAPVSKSDIHGQRGAAPAMAAKVGGPCGVESRAVVPV